MLMPRTPGMLYTLSRSLRDGVLVGALGGVGRSGLQPLPERRLAHIRRQPRVISDCHFRKTATAFGRKPGIKWLSCTEK
jgi:hypothetical protein